MGDKKTHKEPYLKIPAHILNLSQIGLCEKVLLAHIYSFSAKGCWQSNETLGQIFLVCPRTIERWLSAIRKFIIVRNSKGYYRTIWAKSHPDIKYDRNVGVVRQNCRCDSDKIVVRPRQNCRTTNNNTITENKERTIASPSPLPSCGQASATLAYRMRSNSEQIEKFKRNFGRADKIVKLTPQQFEQRRAQQLAALRAKQNS